MTRLASLFSMIALVACGGDGGSGPPIDPTPDSSVTPGGGDDPGTGTSTLLVESTVDAEPMVRNSADPTNFSTEITVAITREGVQVTDGVVQVSSAGGTVNL